MVKRAEIVAEARTYLGVLWRHQGRTRAHGVDCVGLVVNVGTKFSQWTTPPISNYPPRPDGTYLLHFRKHMVAKPVAQAKDGDVLIFAQHAHPCHSGIRATNFGRPTVIHAHALRRHVVEESLDIAKTMVGAPVFCFAYTGIED